MSERLSEKELHAILERISEQGCKAVSQLLNKRARGEAVPEISHLNSEQQEQVMAELEIVMSIYSTCDLQK